MFIVHHVMNDQNRNFTCLNGFFFFLSKTPHGQSYPISKSRKKPIKMPNLLEVWKYICTPFCWLDIGKFTSNILYNFIILKSLSNLLTRNQRITFDHVMRSNTVYAKRWKFSSSKLIQIKVRALFLIKMASWLSP